MMMMMLMVHEAEECLVGTDSLFLHGSPFFFILLSTSIVV